MARNWGLGRCRSDWKQAVARICGIAVVLVAIVPLLGLRSDEIDLQRSPLATAGDPLLVGAPLVTTGESATLLPDGRWLLSGGEQHPDALRLFDPTSGTTENLAPKLHHPRSKHTTTLLPDGNVLILGGESDEGGALVRAAELYSPANSEVLDLGETAITARTSHSAVLLSDGRILIVGGVDELGQPLVSAEILNPVTNDIEYLGSNVTTPIVGGTARLMGTGQALFVHGGTLNEAILFDPQQKTFTNYRIDEGELQSLASPTITYSKPGAAEREVSIDQLLVVRFNKTMAVNTLNPQTVTLVGPEGVVAIRVTPAENPALRSA